MENSFLKVKDYIVQLGYSISSENESEGLMIINKESEGISNMFVFCADPILILEQFIFEIKSDDANVYKELLIKNQDIIHGAFTLSEDGKKVIFRDTLQIENLDLNELEGSLNSLALLLSEYSSKILEFAK